METGNFSLFVVYTWHDAGSTSLYACQSFWLITASFDIRSTSKAMATTLVCLLISSYLLLAGDYHVVSGFTPVTYSSQISTAECGHSDPLQYDQLMEALSKIHQQLGPPGRNPPQNRSCQEILHCFPSAPSGYHEIRVPNGSLVQVYCDMEGTNCGGQGGWMRVAHVNMSQDGASCPQGLTQKNMSGLTLCGQNAIGCEGTLFSSLGLSYSQVCGQLRGYQYWTTDAFQPYNFYRYYRLSDPYVDGASITYGTAPLKHIWTYAAGVATSVDRTIFKTALCPCNTGSTAQVPPYVGSDYYCETGHNAGYPQESFFPNDPLWDGQQCPGVEAPCCTHPNMPWFIKTLGENTTEDIQLRLCANEFFEETLLESITLYVY